VPEQQDYQWRVEGGVGVYGAKDRKPRATHLIERVKNGSVAEARVDDMVVRTFAAYYELGRTRGTHRSA